MSNSDSEDTPKAEINFDLLFQILISPCIEVQLTIGGVVGEEVDGDGVGLAGHQDVPLQQGTQQQQHQAAWKWVRVVVNGYGSSSINVTDPYPAKDKNILQFIVKTRSGLVGCKHHQKLIFPIITILIICLL